MAYPIINSPFLPSIADVPALPPKLKDMAITNPGVSCYECDDGTVRQLSEAEAINLGAAGISCKVADASRCGTPPPFTTPGFVAGYSVLNLGRTLGMARISGR
jgi:hypothetical protein